MKAYVTLLERCGFIVKYYDGWHVWKPGEEDQPVSFGVDDDVKACALEVGAKEAAEWMEKHCAWHFPSIIKPLDRGDYLIRRRGQKSAWPLSNLELIQEATKAGWEKGEGL